MWDGAFASSIHKRAKSWVVGRMHIQSSSCLKRASTRAQGQRARYLTAARCTFSALQRQTALRMTSFCRTLAQNSPPCRMKLRAVRRLRRCLRRLRRQFCISWCCPAGEPSTCARCRPAATPRSASGKSGDSGSIQYYINSSDRRSKSESAATSMAASAPGAVGVQRLQQPASLLRGVLSCRRPGDDIADHRVEVELGALRAVAGGAERSDWRLVKAHDSHNSNCRTPVRCCRLRTAGKLSHTRRPCSPHNDDCCSMTGIRNGIVL